MIPTWVCHLKFLNYAFVILISEFKGEKDWKIGIKHTRINMFCNLSEDFLLEGPQDTVGKRYTVVSLDANMLSS